LEFRDTGIGIAPNEIAKVFDRFYRVRPVAGEDAGGAGLGLTIVQQLLLRCGSLLLKVSWAGFYLQCGIADRSFNPLKRAGSKLVVGS